MSGAPQRLLLVTGAGRSGTSTVAGALERLGLLVPEPRVPADATNPRGFYEPRWVVELHKQVLNGVPVRTNDARPTALARVEEAVGPRVREQVVAWLGEQAGVAAGRDLVVKDPRIMWFTRLWVESAEANGLAVGFLTMLRHPVEVSRSRDTHYLADRDPDFRAKRQTTNVASWVNAAVTTEQVTRGHPRAFVRYADLLSDWRSALARTADQLDVAFPVPPEPDAAHPVDEFIEPTLNRSRVDWDENPVRTELRELATEAWGALGALVEDPVDAAAGERLARVGRDYAELFAFAEAVALDHTKTLVQVARRQLRAELRPPGDSGPAPDPPARAPGPAARMRAAAGRLRAATRRARA